MVLIALQHSRFRNRYDSLEILDLEAEDRRFDPGPGHRFTQPAIQP